MTKRRILKGVNKGAITSYKVKKTEPPIVFEDDECYEEEEEQRAAASAKRAGDIGKGQVFFSCAL